MGDTLIGNDRAIVLVVGAFIGLAALAGAALAPGSRFEHGLLAAVTALLALTAGFMLSMGARAGFSAGWTIGFTSLGFAIVGAIVGAGLGTAIARFGRPKFKGHPQSVEFAELVERSCS